MQVELIRETFKHTRLLCIGFLCATPLTAQPFFTEIPDGMPALSFVRSPTQSRGMAVGDYDNDGWPDLFMSEQNTHKILLLHNEGQGRFADQTDAIESPTVQAVEVFRGGGSLFGDYDNDGDLDLLVAIGSWFSPTANVLLRNDKGVFTDVTVAAGLTDTSSTDNGLWFDYDRDGFIDLYLGNPCGDDLNILYRNKGNGTFVDVTEQVGLAMEFNDPDCGLGGSNGGMSAGDFNDDGWPDLYLGAFNNVNRLFWNDRQGGFVDAGQSEVEDPGFAFGTAVGDVDNNGSLDIFQAAGGGGSTPDLPYRSSLLVNRGAGQFLDVSESAGLGGLGHVQIRIPSLEDLDNDGDLDLLVTSPHFLYVNRGDGTFVDGTDESGLPEENGFTSVLGDYSGDGFVDIALGNGHLYHNLGNGHHWLRVEVVGIESNRNGIGSRLTATAGTLRQTREILSGQGYTQRELVAHFGLEGRTQVDQLQIRWPSGQVDVLEDIQADQKIRVFEGRSGFHTVEPTRWEHSLPDSLQVHSRLAVQALVQPALFAPGARITRVSADLSELGGPTAVPLTARDDGRYALDTSVSVGGLNGLYAVKIHIDQDTFMGPHWSALSKTVTLLPQDEWVFDDGVGPEWTLDEGTHAAVDRQATAQVFSGSSALEIQADGFAISYTPEAPLPATGYVGLGFALHRGDTQDPQEGAAPTTIGPRIGFISDRLNPGGELDIFVMGADGGRPQRLVRLQAVNQDLRPQWSPNGRKLAFNSHRSTTDFTETFVADANGRNPLSLTAPGAPGQRHPDWSPDSQRLAFWSRRTSPSQIFSMDADGGNLQQLTNHPAQHGEPDWSPDGSRIAFGSDRDAIVHIYVMDADGSNQSRLTQGSGVFNIYPDWSPDGTQIAYTSLNSDFQNANLYVMDADGGNPVNLSTRSGIGEKPRWSPDGRQIAFESDRGGNREVYVMDADGSNLTNLTQHPGFDGNPTWLPAAVPDLEPFREQLLIRVNETTLSLAKDELPTIGLDLDRDGWQVTEIPLTRFGRMEAIESIGLSGEFSGTFYLDDIRLIAADPPSQITAVLEDYSQTLPQDIALEQNYPNPFNSGTAIRFALPVGGQVELALYNLVGQKVQTLVQGQRPAGTYTVRWDGRDEAGRELASGLYLYRLQAGGQVKTRKLLLLR
ncbi:MAG: T9SS type A sorting domain-containing protein [Candidatus Latescibacteria bacterium]|nr:T9SS type A sorting domain-containing protein [Candidatus Latescibacterota bacterium]